MVDTPQPKASLINAQLGPYAIDALVGRGAMGAVYLARDRHLRRNVALKVMLGSLARNPEAIRQFRLEAQAAAPLRHPNIVRIYEAGIREGTPFIAMEYIEGESLEQFLQRTPQLDWEQALHVARQVAEALACAHEAGIIHRDVKPANMLIDRRGRIRLTDFGIANRDTMEQVGGRPPMGTLEYMAPEVLAAKGSSIQTDLYALGVVVYRMLSGKMPFAAGSPEALAHRIQEGKVAPLRTVMPDLPDDVARFAMRLLAIAPEDRPPNGADVVATIDRLHRDKGGASAVPEALDKFIREQSQARSIRLDGRNASDRSVASTRKRASTGSLKTGPRTALYAAGLAVLFCVAILGGLRPWAADRPALAATAALEMEALSSTLHLLPVDARAWKPTAIAGNRKAGIHYCLLQGQANTNTAHGAMILAIEDQSARILAASPSPWKAAEGDVLGMHLIHDGAEEALPYALHRDAPADGGGWRLTPLDDAGPFILLPEGFLVAGTAPLASSFPVALHTESHQVATILKAHHEQGFQLALLNPSHGIFTGVGRTLTAPDASILPGVLRFSSDGQHLFFFRHNGADELALWCVALASGAETPLAVGAFRPETLALDPRGQWVALTEHRKDGPEVILFSIGGDQAQPLGPGRSGPATWLPDGSGLVLAVSEGNSEQLIRVAVDTGERTAIGAMAAHGLWAAAMDAGQVLSLEHADGLRLARHYLIASRAHAVPIQGVAQHAARP